MGITSLSHLRYLLLTVPRRLFCCGLVSLSLRVGLLFIIDVLFALLTIT